MKQKLVFLLIIVFELILLSCGNSDGNNQNIAKKDTLATFEVSEGKSFVYHKYKLPLSVDIFKYLKSKNIEFSIKNLHNLSNQEKYFTDEKRALALGIYSSDLSNAAIYDMSAVVVDYFGVSIDLAHKLDIEEGYNSELMDKAYKNLENNDSLIKFASEAYWKTCTNLEKDKRNNILPLVVLGSWIESMHVLAKVSIGSTSENGINNQLYGQKEHLISLISYFNDISKAESNSNLKNSIKKWLNKLEKIHARYNEIDDSKRNDRYKNLIAQIEELRTEMIE